MFYKHPKLALVLLVSLTSVACSNSTQPFNKASTQNAKFTSKHHAQQQSRRVAFRKASVSQQRRTSVTHRPPLASQQASQRPVVSKSAASRSVSRSMSRSMNRPMSREAQARMRLVNLASKQLGRPYKWGGESPAKGFDCSGLMQYTYKNALGVSIPRTAAQQRDNSRTIPIHNLRPGDMLFFKTSKRTNHVGMYIGNRQFIHAPSRGNPVQKTSIDNSYWRSKYVKSGRYL